MADPEDPPRDSAGRSEPATEEPAAPAARPRRRNKRKRRPAPAPPTREPLDAAGRERPLFLLEFPADPQLEKLIAAFEAGDYARVRREAPRLAERAADPAVREAALELRRRIDPDPLAKYLLLAAVTLLAFLALWAYQSHAH